jgi:hypothetical protein
LALGLQLSYAGSKANLTAEAAKMPGADFSEMYGIGTVYLRLKGIVPPSTERQNAARGRGGRGK